MKVAVAQLNPTVGDVEGNLKKIEATLRKCAVDSPDIVVFPELFLVGYPPRDLLEKRWFIQSVDKAVGRLRKLSSKHPQSGILVGVPSPTKKDIGTGLYNSAVLFHKGHTLLSQPKSLLPSYDVFDEARYFDPGEKIRTVRFKGEVLGISVCEDAWNDPALWKKRNYDLDPIASLVKGGATVLINLSASPFHVGKDLTRYKLVSSHAKKHNVPFIFVNQVGANDELIFDGRSLCVDSKGDIISALPSFEECVRTVDLAAAGTGKRYVPDDRTGSIHKALVLGIRDYLRKCGFKKAVLGLSGGIDSALTCCLAAEALGPENVLGVSMPSPYSSKGSVTDSMKLAENLGVKFMVLPISDVYNSYLNGLKATFSGMKADIAEENVQARIRGNMLMAISNKFGHLVLSTGNKSELAIGYCTLYGDMSGGLAAISDVPKTMIYELAADINSGREVIPAAIINKAPSAELRPNQTDQDTLPPYDVLDRILNYYIDEGLSKEEIIRKKFGKRTVEWVIKTVNLNEYKRRQAAPGLKVTTKAFGVGRRMPIAAKYGT